MALTISVATLTYGERKEFLYQTVDELLNQNFEQIYIYCNGISLPYFQEISEKYQQSNINLLYSGKNLGSAGGYYELLKHVTENDHADHLLLLDDDNLIPSNCVEAITNLTINDDELYYFHRPDRVLPKIAKELNKPEYVLGSTNSFLGRDFFTFFSNSNTKYKGDLAAAPYGGLLLSRKALDTGVLPKKELYLYADDYEYTYRLVTQYGFQITFSDNIEIEDLEKSFHLKKGNRVLSNRYSHSSEVQLYYSVRNNTWLGLNRCQSKLLFLSNLCIFSPVYLGQFLLNMQFQSIKTFSKALKDGFSLYLSVKGN